MDVNDVSVVVVGGGVAGLAAARRLAIDLGPSAVILFEAEGRLGGKIVTESADGFTIEGGPDSFLTTRRGVMAFCSELGLTDRLVGVSPAPRRAWVRRDGRLHELPEGLTGLVPGRITPLLRSRLLSAPGRLRAALELVLPPREASTDESIATFAIRRFGREAYEWLMEPLLSGIYAGDGTALSLMATFPQLRDLERVHGSVFRGVVRARRAGGAASVLPPFVAPRSGMGELVGSFERELSGVLCHRNAVVERVEIRSDACFVRVTGGRTVRCDAVVLAAPAFAAAGMVQSGHDELSSILHEFCFVSTAIVSLGFSIADIPQRLRNHGCLHPRAEGGPVVACSWSSAKWPGRAPAGSALIRVFVGRAGHDEIVEEADDVLVRLARRELQEVLGITAAPVIQRIHRWPRGMPQYILGHSTRIERLDAALAKSPGLYVAGHSYHGIGIPDCIASGERAATSAAAHVRSVAA